MQWTSEDIQAIGGGVAAILAGIGLWFGNRKSSGKPPEQRAPSAHELREALTELRGFIKEMRESRDEHDDDHRQIARQLDRIEDRLKFSAEIQSWRERTIPPR